jgi:WD40 repeat protein
LDDGNTAPPPSVLSDAEPASGAAAARAMFQNKSSRGLDKGAAGAQKITSLHTRAITGISVQSGNKTLVTTASLDGKIILWDLHSTMLSIGTATLNLA